MDVETSSHFQEPEPARTRRQHTRSRAGCATCRKRHVKCDEARPICTNCKLGSRACEYISSALCLRDRRAQARAVPGALEVWSINGKRNSPLSSSNGESMSQSPPVLSWKNLVVGHGPDPFDTLGIPMQYKSRELLQYFYHTADAFGVVPRNTGEDCIGLVLHDPTALRNTLLLAGLHYSWNTGLQSSYEETTLVTKIDTIRSVNEWIKEGRHTAFTNSAKQVATLSLIECGAGNVTRAEMHLEGLATILEASQRAREREFSIDDELVDRYFILVCNFVHGFKSRVTDVVSNHESFRHDPSSATRDVVETIIHKHHERELDGLSIRLKSFRLFPHFIASTLPSTKVKDIEVEQYLITLENITRMELRRRAVKETGEWDDMWNILWMEGGPTRLFHRFVASHVQSLSREPRSSSLPDMESAPGTPKLRSSWLGISAATGLYLNGVLDVFNAGETMIGKLLAQVLTILFRDIDATRPVNRTQACSREGDLWLWKVMSGAFTMRKKMVDDDYFADERVAVLESMWSRLAGDIQHWSRLSKVSTWEGAESTLQRITWMSESNTQEILQEIWDGSVAHRW